MENVFRKIQLACTLALCAWSSALAWHEYQPMVVEGRRWDVLLDESFVIEGDTVFNGQTFKKVYRYDYDDYDHQILHFKEYYCALREEDKKVYRCVEDWQGNPNISLLCDFSWGVLNRRNEQVGILVYDAMNIVIHGQERRVVNIVPPYDEIPETLVEGIGYLEFPFYVFSGNNVYWLYDGNGELLYDVFADGFVFSPDDGRAIVDGEINGDGQVDIADVNAVINMMPGKPLAPRWDDVAADMDLNGTIDIADVNAVINAMLGK